MTKFDFDESFWRGEPRFIVLEGDEGGGKSTQVVRLAEWLGEVSDREVVTVLEPGTGVLAAELRKLLLDPLMTSIGTYEEVLMMAAARVDTRMHYVMPALAAGKWVISDRGELSTIVYQGFARDEGAMKFVKQIMDEIRVVVRRGDLYVVLSIPYELSIERLRLANKLPDRFEGAAERFRHRVNKGFEMIEQIVLGEYRIARVDASLALDEVTQQLITSIESSF